MVKSRSEASRRRRLLTRLALSTDTLLRQHLGLQAPQHLGHHIPILPSIVLKYLRDIASGISVEDLDLELTEVDTTQTAVGQIGQQDHPEVISRSHNGAERE